MSPPSAGSLAGAHKGVALLHRHGGLAGGSPRPARALSAAPRGGGLQRLDEGCVRAVNRVILVHGRARSQPLLLDVFDEVRERGRLVVRWLFVDL
jgi:hypothetical protein